MDNRSDDYHDYVFKDGKVLGLFEEMYKHSKEIPWHQDKTADQVFVDIDLAILKHFLPKKSSYSICDLGCGLGYVTNRIYKEFQEFMPELAVTGIDISKSASEQAKAMHMGINFCNIDILNDDISGLYSKYDLLYVKDILWYIINDADVFFRNAKKCLSLKDIYMCFNLFRIWWNLLVPISFLLLLQFQNFSKSIFCPAIHHQLLK